MSRDEIVLKVNQLMHEGFEIPMDALTPEATLFDQLGLDSLDAVDMLVHLEEKMGIKVAGDRLMAVRTMGDVYALVEDLLPQAKAASGLANPEAELRH